MSNVTDVLYTVRLYKDVAKAINKLPVQRDRDFLNIMIGRIDYRDWRRDILSPKEFMDTSSYWLYVKHNMMYKDEFLKRFWIELYP